MNFGFNFNDRKLFTREQKSTTRSIDMNRYSNKFGATDPDTIKMRRLKFKEQFNKNINLNREMNKNNSVSSTILNKPNNARTREEKQFNHIEALKNIKRGF